jgi:hypothetical protein
MKLRREEDKGAWAIGACGRHSIGFRKAARSRTMGAVARQCAQSGTAAGAHVTLKRIGRWAGPFK